MVAYPSLFLERIAIQKKVDVIGKMVTVAETRESREPPVTF
jgi:hypothetical protein